MSLNSEIPQARTSYDNIATKMWEVSTPYQRAIISVLAGSNQYGLDPHPMLMNLSTEQSNRRRLLGELFADRLHQGKPLLEAIEDVPGLLPDESTLALRMAESEGELNELFAAYLRRPMTLTRAKQHHEDTFAKLVGVFMKLMVISWILAFIAIKLAPEFQKLLQEFEIEPTTIFYRWLGVIDSLAAFWFVPLLGFFVAIPFCFSSFRRYLRRWNPTDWRIEVFPIAIRQRRLLSLLLRSSQPLTKAIQMIRQNESGAKLARRFYRAKQSMGQGIEPWESLHTHGIINRQEREGLKRAADDITRSWIVEWSAGSLHRRRTSVTTFVIHLVIALVNIAIAVFVAFTAFAIIETLISIIGHFQ